jgi:hypothetical protein
LALYRVVRVVDRNKLQVSRSTHRYFATGTLRVIVRELPLRLDCEPRPAQAFLQVQGLAGQLMVVRTDVMADQPLFFALTVVIGTILILEVFQLLRALNRIPSVPSATEYRSTTRAIPATRQPIKALQPRQS